MRIPCNTRGASIGNIPDNFRSPKGLGRLLPQVGGMLHKRGAVMSELAPPFDNIRTEEETSFSRIRKTKAIATLAAFICPKCEHHKKYFGKCVPNFEKRVCVDCVYAKLDSEEKGLTNVGSQD